MLIKYDKHGEFRVKMSLFYIMREDEEDDRAS